MFLLLLVGCIEKYMYLLWLYIDEQDYSWIKNGMIFPFVEHVDRYLTVDGLICYVYVVVELDFQRTLFRSDFRGRLI